MSNSSNSSLTDYAEAADDNTITKEIINKLTVPSLKTILGELQQPINGKKSELVSRIIETYEEDDEDHKNLINSALAAKSKGNQSPVCLSNLY